MVDPAGNHPAELQYLIREVQLLHDRLHRLTVALSLSQELVAETFERMADGGGPQVERFRVGAEQARSAAEECRAFATRMVDLGSAPDGLVAALHAAGGLSAK